MIFHWIFRVLLIAACSASFAQGVSYPTKSITIIVPYAGGSGSDVQARLFGQHLSSAMGQPVVVENRPGASGAIGMQALRTAPADGHTIALGGGSLMVVNPLITRNLGYDPKDFIAVSGIGRTAVGFVVGANSPHRTITDVVAAAKQENRALNIGTYAAIYELGAAWLGALSNTRVTNVSYKGGAQVVSDLLGGHLELGFIDLSAAGALIKSGKLRVLALSTEQRSANYPGVPTMIESYPDYQVTSWTAFLVRVDTPPTIIQKLSSTLQGLFGAPEVKEYFDKSGISPLRSGVEEMRAFQQQDAMRVKAMVEAAHMEPR